MSQTVTDAYIDGIKEARLSLSIEGDAACPLEHLRLIGNANCLLGSEPHADFLRGQRDFWRNQITKK